VSLIEDQIRAANAARKEENRIAELDHRVEMAKIRLAQDHPKWPFVEEFIARRVWNANQTRWWKPSDQVLPIKKRQF
jgi:hypothetical protein